LKLILSKYFSPTPEEYEDAVEMLRLYDESQKQGVGVAVKNGKFIGPPMVIAANKIIQKAQNVQKRIEDLKLG
jgi:citrate lyase subunit beta/citryl-CoA lyase